MSNPDISIILPVYNGQNYIRKTLDSILMQDFTNYEIIAIDDGSSDCSAEILNEYASKDYRIKVCIQANHGICATRNRGIREAKAKFIMFCDHDDEYLPGYLRAAYRTISENHVDFVKFSCKEIYLDKEKIVKEHIEILTPKEYREDQVKEFLLQYINDNEYIWDGIYSKDILQEVGGFDEKYKSGCEDLALILDLAEKAESCICRPEVFYLHNIRNSFSTSRKYHESAYWDVMETWKRRFEILKPQRYPEYEQAKLRMLVWAMCGMFSFSNCDITEKQMKDRFKELYDEGYQIHGSIFNDSSEKKKALIYLLYRFKQFSLLSKICMVKRNKAL